jgi:hypothetical protein
MSRTHHDGSTDGRRDGGDRHDQHDRHDAIDHKVSPLVEPDAGPTVFPAANAAPHASRIHLAPSHGTTATAATAGASYAQFTVAGPTFDSVAAYNGYYTIPPDNASAAGKSAVVVAVNGEVESFSKTGSLLGNPQSLASLFNTSSSAFPFDPSVAYDPVSDHFVVTATTPNPAPPRKSSSRCRRTAIRPTAGTLRRSTPS